MANLIDLSELPELEARTSQYSDLVQQLHDIRQRDLAELSKDEVLSLAMEATELSLKLMQLAKTKDERQLHKENSSRLLTQAETIKKTGKWDPQSNNELLDFKPLNPVKSTTLNIASRPTLKPRSSLSNTKTPSASSSSPSRKTPEPLPPASPPPNKQVTALKSPVHVREPTTGEKVLLWRGSKLPGGPYPPWLDDKGRTIDHHSFARDNKYVDKTVFSLSSRQRDMFFAWEKPEEALPPPHMRSEHVTGSPLMQAPGPTDFVQDAATDCSVVASMCACMARVEKGFPMLLSAILFPQDEASSIPVISPNGKYIVRLNFNGCFRRVEIDDRLPVTMNDRLLHIIDRNNPRLLWPALLEKAYLKIRGGYDFPGSNSGTDLWILTGWIPEQVLLQHEDTDVDRTWDRVHQAFNYGDVLITLGSGKMTKKTEKELGLVSEHDYAVLDLREGSHGRKEILIKNPWLNGPTWQDRFGTDDTDSDSSDSESSKSDRAQDLVSIESRSPKKTAKQPPPAGTFWMSFQDVLQNFESLYLNWNPGLFKYRADSHLEWELAKARSPMYSLRANPQYAIHPSMDGQVWVILSRHLAEDQPNALDDTNPLNITKIGNRSRTQPDEFYISLYTFKSNGRRVVSMRNPLKSNPFVDTPQVLVKLNVRANEPITIVPAEQMLESIAYNFTLSVFSHHKLRVTKAKRRYTDSAGLTGQWTEETSGGNAKLTTYIQNPQYALHLPASSPLALILESSNENVSINVKLLRGQGKRFETELKTRDVVLESGEYRRHCVIASTSKAYAENHSTSEFAYEAETVIAAGNYTLVLSTFNAGETGHFTLTVESNVNASLNRIARSGAGRILKRFSDVSFGPGVRRVGAPFTVHRLVTVYFVVKVAKRAIHDKNVDPADAGMPPSPVRLSIEDGLGPDRTMVVASGDGAFMDATSAGGVRTEDCQLGPARKMKSAIAVQAGAIASRQMWLIVERMGTDLGSGEERFHVDSYGDVFDWDQLGVWRDVTPGIS